MDTGSPPHVEFPTYRFNQIWIEKIGFKRNWGWSGKAWAIWWDRMAINVLKRPGLRLRVSGSRFNEYWSKRVWRELAPLFLFSHVTGFLRRCEQTTTHQQQTKDTIKTHRVNQSVFISATNRSKGERVSCGNRCDSKAAAAWPRPTPRGTQAAEHTAQPAAPSQAPPRHLSWSFPSSVALTAFLSIRRERPGRFSSSSSFTETVGLGWSEMQDKPVLMVACALSWESCS